MAANEAQEKINGILHDILSLKLQMERLMADAESEKETRARTSKRIYIDIEKVENEFKNLVYGADRKSGIIVELDRLKQESEERKEMKKHVRGLWSAILILIIEQIVLFIIKK